MSKIFLVSDPELCKMWLRRARSAREIRNGDTALWISGPYGSIEAAEDAAVDWEEEGQQIVWSSFLPNQPMQEVVK